MALVGGGGYAQYAVAYADHLIPVPETMSFESAACVCESYITAFLNIFMLGGLKGGQVLLAHGGGGGVNTAAIQLCRTLLPNARVVVTASAGKIERVRQLGADLVEIVGLFDDRDDDRSPQAVGRLPKLGKIGDLVEVNETFGQVESIGARSTSIKTFDNFHIIVPNSTFLESNVINWTHTDTLVRISLVVGVAYGSPTRRVEELIQQAVRELEKVVIPPEPTVLFDDFGDSALIFEALFWIIMKRPMDRRRALSDVRFRIDELFRENGIVIAFPQRDVHLDNLKPLRVRLLKDDLE